MAMIAAYIDYTSKLEKLAMSDFTVTRRNEKWKEYGLMKSVQRF